MQLMLFNTSLLKVYEEVAIDLPEDAYEPVALLVLYGLGWAVKKVASTGCCAGRPGTLPA